MAFSMRPFLSKIIYLTIMIKETLVTFFYFFTFEYGRYLQVGGSNNIIKKQELF